jgi:hypothetical protein
MVHGVQVGCYFSGLKVSLPLLCLSFSLSSLFSSAAFAWADVRVASVRKTLSSPTVSLDQRSLLRVSEDMRASLAPVYAVSSDGEEVSELVGLRDAQVWQAVDLGRTISMERLGVVVDIADRRVRDAEMGVMGSRAILAYEDPVQKALVAVLAVGRTLYSVHRSGAAVSIVRIGSVSE